MEKISFPLTLIDKNHIQVLVSTSIYDKEAINATCYKYSGQFYIHQLKKIDDIEITFECKDGSLVDENMVKQFCTDLIDQQLRVDIDKKVGHIRDLIVEEAFKPVNK